MPRPAAWFAASVALLALGATPPVVEAPVRQALVGTLGDPGADLALDARGRTGIAQIMTVDRPRDGEIVSYEYVVGDTMYVGYQHAPADAAPFGVRAMDWVDIEQLPDAPATSRLQGRWLRPRARPVAWLDRTRPWRQGLSLVFVAAGAVALGISLRAGRARAR